MYSMGQAFQVYLQSEQADADTSNKTQKEKGFHVTAKPAEPTFQYESHKKQCKKNNYLLPWLYEA